MSLHITSDTKSVRKRPTTKGELQSLIKQELKHQGPDADLNFIDTSMITDMSFLFYDLDIHSIKIDRWNVSSVNNMHSMFFDCTDFNCDLSKWDVANVEDMIDMFWHCKNLNCNLSHWDVSSIRLRNNIFLGATTMFDDPDLQPKFK